MKEADKIYEVIYKSLTKEGNGMEKGVYYFKVPFIQLENYDLDEATVKIISEETSRCFQVVALHKVADILTIGMVNPENKEVITILENRLKYKVMAVKVDIQ